MSVAKSSSGGNGFLSKDSVGGSLHPIHGVAIGSNDITVGHKSGKRKLWTPEVLEGSASTLAGKEIVVDHENRNSREVVGEVTDAMFKDGVGVIYKGVIDDDELATKIGHGWLEVSPRIIHSKNMDERDGLYIPESVRKFDNLSIVVRGASPSNSVNLGEPEELMSVEELQSAFGSDDSVVEEYQDFEGQVDMEKYLFPTREGALGASEGLGCSGSHAHEMNGKTMYMPCDSHDQFLKSLSESEEMATDKEWRQGDFVQWSSSGGTARGRVTDWTDDGTFDSEIDGDVSVSGTEDDPAALIDVYQESSEGWEETDTTVGHKFSTLNEWNPDNLVDENEYAPYNSVEIEELEEDLDEVYSEWSDTVNMTASELRRWSGNPCSREASVDPEAVIERNLNLLETNKGDWGREEIEDANRTISFINRMRGNSPEGDASDGANGCPTDWAISLLNWAYNPFDDLPKQPDDEDLEDVEELETLGIEGDIEDIIVVETEEMSQDTEMAKHTKSEMQTASQMASQTKMTKKEALRLLSGLNPTRTTDARGMGEMLAKAMKTDEMEKMMDEMSKHMDSEMGSGSGGGSKKDSPLNRIS